MYSFNCLAIVSLCVARAVEGGDGVRHDVSQWASARRLRFPRCCKWRTPAVMCHALILNHKKHTHTDACKLDLTFHMYAIIGILLIWCCRCRVFWRAIIYCLIGCLPWTILFDQLYNVLLRYCNLVKQLGTPVIFSVSHPVPDINLLKFSLPYSAIHWRTLSEHICHFEGRTQANNSRTCVHVRLCRVGREYRRASRRWAGGLHIWCFDLQLSEVERCWRLAKFRALPENL